ncbi:hypothetical protein [Serratia sp. BW106]|uniref:hypothetical protein n=1 Tax=Serratia sp. BW106 TaxID=1884636 RepID=UPI000BFFEA75|nr:hypothetical protein [Serratia sp. BW106]
MNNIEIKKSNDDRIAVTLLVDDVELANKIYISARDEFGLDVEITEEVTKMLNKSNKETEDNFMSSLNKKLKIK